MSWDRSTSRMTPPLPELCRSSHRLYVLCATLTSLTCRALQEDALQAALLTGPGLLELRDVDSPVPEAGEAAVRIRAVGICGTDLSIFKGKIPVAYPRIMGHEMVGEVIAGPAGSPEPGTRVIVDPNVACGRCPRCREGRANLCRDGWLLGRDRDGGLREIVAAPAGNLHRIPDDLEDHVAPLIQVLTTCVHAQRMTEVFPGDSVVVVGLGVTGLLHVQLAKIRGAWPVVGVTRSPEKLELARALGADVTVAAGDEDADERVIGATSGPDGPFGREGARLRDDRRTRWPLPLLRALLQGAGRDEPAGGAGRGLHGLDRGGRVRAAPARSADVPPPTARRARGCARRRRRRTQDGGRDLTAPRGRGAPVRSN